MHMAFAEVEIAEASALVAGPYAGGQAEHLKDALKLLQVGQLTSRCVCDELTLTAEAWNIIRECPFCGKAV